MLRIYFDDELIDVEAYTELDNEYKLFTDTFKLGSVASNTFKLSVLKTAVNSQPTNVRIEDDDTVMHFVVDNVTEDDYVYSYTLTDKLLNFNFDYDASVLINSKAELEEDCYLSDIWKDMCDKADVEYDETYVFENDIVVNWYDNRVQARRYLSYIAELQSGYACILENGKQSFKKQNRSSVKTIDADECSDLIIGEKKTITRVVYDGGAFKWEFGDETGDTLYLQSDNVYITSETIVENIYNNIKDFEFYIIDVPQAPMDSSIKAGDVITINDNGVMYPTIAQYTMSYAGGWTGGYKISVNTDRQQETQITRTADNVRNLNVKVDRLNNEFSIIAEEIEKLTDYIRNVGTTGNYLKLPDTPLSNGAINKLSIKGFELMPLYPGMVYPSEYTFPGVLSFYTLIFDTINTFNNNPHYVYVNSPIPLQKSGTVYDELLIEANKVKVIQRIGYDDVNEEWSELSNPITHELNNVLLPTFDGDTYISVRYFDNLVYDAEYLIKNDLTSNFSTQLESSSHFKMNQNEISSKVSKDGVISEINQSAEQIAISASKIALEGYTTINDGFSVDLDGNATMNNATINGSVLKLADDTEIVGGSGVLTSLQFEGQAQLGIIHRHYEGSSLVKTSINLDFLIPEEFTIKSAYVTLKAFKTQNFYDLAFTEGTTDVFGGIKNIRLYKMVSPPEWAYSDYLGIFSTSEHLSEITGSFGDNGYTNPGTEEVEIISIDLKNHIDIGMNYLRIQTANNIPTYNDNGVLLSAEQSQMTYAILTIFGFTK